MKIKDGHIEIHISDLFSNLETEDKREIAGHLIWDKEVFDELVDSLTTSKIVTRSFSSMVYESRLKFIDQLPDMARNTIRSLLYELEGARLEENRWRKWAWELWHAYPDGYHADRPETPDYVQASWKTEEALTAYIEEGETMPTK